MPASGYLEFHRHDPSDRKTAFVEVISVSRGILLGHISWYGAWRQYCFFPNEATIWNTDCMAEIREEIAKLMGERRTKALLKER